ncbi:family 2 glycosyl transferase [Clostridium paridis]|uniref:Family 2 glycosyl transferase n=1 Tax=Clostridium paridis TaxID=2803863 RepID=A0A937K3B4_9CLOT|nr:family 2 glycosyl transferase [Clostridium paridis]MBL4930313.1 family 2 glycosyl transferase [Clostridium paridis]
MKKYFLTVTLIIVFIVIGIKIAPVIRDKTSLFKNDVAYIAKADNKSFYIYKYGRWKKEFIKGVNLGLGKPGHFPGELALTKEEYLDWFKEISNMNSNTIRVYTTLKPEFYEALYEYNKKNFNPIYVMQGVWVNEEDMASIGDAFDKKILDTVKEDTKNLIDIIHGNAELKEQRGFASGKYTHDVSNYISAWILGIEWDPAFVISTNEKNAAKKSYDGNYIYTKGASPFENWLAEIQDYAIKYETDKYKMQRPTSFTNWVTTDLLSHPNEPLPKEDLVPVNPMHILSKENFKPGLFASYHIYPYYPDFMNYQKEYIQNKSGEVNTYKAYLEDLIKEHSIPVLVAEFGIPASRGKAHENIHTGFNQGEIDEKSQGEMEVSMLQDIYNTGYAGGLIFTWQDEWFKRTWNTMDLDIPDRRPFWSNPQTNEQEFGVLAFDPGEKESICYVDGNTKEWINSNNVSKTNSAELYVKSDEKYIYFWIKKKDLQLFKDKIIISIDTLKNSGNSYYKDFNLNLNMGSEFLLFINGKDNSRVLVDSYYDSFYYIYSKLGMIDINPNFDAKNSGTFNPIYLCLNRQLKLPQDKRVIPFTKYETGKLFYGNGNPKNKDFNSLSDFYTNGDNIEIRIPWQLFNVMDPSEKMIMNDLHIEGIKPIKAQNFQIGLSIFNADGTIESGNIGTFNWDEWEMPKYHERLKPSYYILKDAFKRIGAS